MVLNKITIALAFLFSYSIANAQINSKAPCKTRDSTFISAPVESVWKVLVGFEKWNQNFDFIKSAKLKDSLAVGRKLDWQTTKLKLTSTILKVEPNKQLLWKGGKYGVLVYHNWIFIALSPNQTLLISEESQQGIAPTIFKKKFQKSLKNGSVKWLNQIKQNSEKL